jgi:hypothetical protein
VTQQIIGRGAAEGWSRDETVGYLMEHYGRPRAELIAHYETADAQERGSHIAYAASGQVKGTEWLLGPNPCDLCAPLGGKVVALGDEFAPGVKHPPFHPRCTCATSPVLS